MRKTSIVLSGLALSLAAFPALAGKPMPVPEPGTLSLLIAGAGALAALRLGKRR